MCNSFPGANACNDVHKYLTGSADTIFKESGPEGQIIPITKIGNSSYSLSGGYAKYLTIIKALIPYSNKAIKMTLPESPYRQIYDPDAYTTFQAAVKTVRKRGMLGFKRKSKCIVLSKGDLQLFQKEFAKDLITNNASEMNKYVRYHYGYIVMSIKLFRPLNCMIKTFFHVDLKWVIYEKLPEFLLIDDQMAILFKPVIKETGKLDAKKSRIIIDLMVSSYLKDFGCHEDAMTTKDFFLENVVKGRFFEYCARYWLAKQQFKKEGKVIDNITPDEWDHQLSNIKNRKIEEWEENIKGQIREKIEIWRKEVNNLIKKW